MEIFNLVYKTKKAKTKKNGQVDHLKMAHILIKTFLPLPSCKYVNPSHCYYLKNNTSAPGFHSWSHMELIIF